MQHLFVSYEIAEFLKEKGFDEPCFCVYNKHLKSLLMSNCNDLNNQPKNSDLGSISIAAPTFEQVTDWLREKHEIYVWIGSYSVWNDELDSYEEDVECSFIEKKGSSRRSSRSHCPTQKLKELAIKDAIKLI